MKIIKRFLLKIYRILYRENIKYQIEIQRKQCCAGEHTVFYESTAISDSHGNKENIQIGDYSHIKGELITFGLCGKIIIGKHCYMGPNTHIWAVKGVTIGDRVLIGPDCYIFDNDVHPIDAETRHRQFLEIVSIGQPDWVKLNEKAVVIEDDAWIGAGCCILKGVRIGKGAIIGAGSVVVHDIPSYAIAHGNPAKVSRMISNEMKKCLDE